MKSPYTLPVITGYEHGPYTLPVIMGCEHRPSAEKASVVVNMAHEHG